MPGCSKQKLQHSSDILKAIDEYKDLEKTKEFAIYKEAYSKIKNTTEYQALTKTVECVND